MLQRISLLLCGVALLVTSNVLGQSDTGWVGRQNTVYRESAVGQSRAHQFEILLGIGGRTDESGWISRDYSIGGGMLYRVNEVLAIQAGVAAEKTRVENYFSDGHGSASTGELLFRIDSPGRPLAPFAFAGLALRHLSFEDEYGYARENEAGLAFGAGLAVAVSDVLFLDLSLRHEIDRALDHTVYFTTTPPIDPLRPFYVYERTGVPDGMYNPTMLQIRFRHVLK